VETIARNRAIKKTLETAFGRGKVRVRGGRGTSYGWVDIDIDWTPRDVEQRREMETQVLALLSIAGLMKEIGTYGYDDPGSDYGYGSRMHLGFNTARYYLTQRMSDGTMIAKADYHSEWEMIPDTASAGAA